MAKSKGAKKQGRKPGRQVSRWTPTARAELLEKLVRYIKATPIPILAEFAWKNGTTRTHLYEFDELKDAIKLCHEKKEAQLERLGLKDKIQKTMAIFSLKQLGWRDRQEISGPGGGPIPVQIIDDIPASPAK